MSIITGDMVPRAPEWLGQHYRQIQDEGHTIENPTGLAYLYARQTEIEALDFLALQLEDPLAAIDALPTCLQHCCAINQSVYLPHKLTSDQFGLFINIASRNYDKLDEDAAQSLHHHIYESMAGNPDRHIAIFASEIRNPDLLCDLVAHNEYSYWPAIDKYAEFLESNQDWDETLGTINLNVYNPLMFALAAPQNSIDPLVRAKFRERYPETTQRGIEIIAAGLYNRGAHSELLSEYYPDKPEEYKNWEATIDDGLDKYGAEYRKDILAAIEASKWKVFNETELTPPVLLDKLTHTSFSVTADGRLLRQTE